jgi:hypothetical protein
MLREMTWREFREWMAFSELEPFDEVRADIRCAHIVATLLNLHRKKGARAVTVQDVRLLFGDEKEIRRQTPQQQEAVAKMFVSLFNDLEAEKQQKRERASDRRQSRHPVRQALSGR